MEQFKQHLVSAQEYIVTLIKWIIIGSAIGAVGGIIGSLFHLAVDEVAVIRTANPQIMFGLPFVGLIIVYIYRASDVEGRGTNTIIESIHTGKNVPLTLAPAIFIGTILTHLCGGSAGREGAALQLGGDVGCHVGHIFKLDDKDMRIATLCGMSSLFSALFGTPITATIFALEVISVGIVYYSALVPSFIAALVGFFVAGLFGITPTTYAVTAMDVILPSTLVSVSLLATIFAVVSIIFCMCLSHGHHFIDKFIPNPYIRVFIGGLAILALTFASGSYNYNGAGMQVIADAIAGTAVPEAFMLKIIFTTITIGSGFKGGEVVPTFFVGATLGCVLGPIFGLPADFAAALGLVSIFCGVVNCPIASIFLAVELFGASGIIYFTLSCGLSYMLSGYYGLYSSQKIMYSKLRTEFINTTAR